MRRIREGITQAKLAGNVGLTFQQIQKYEAGTSAGLLYRLSQAPSALPCFATTISRAAHALVDAPKAQQQIVAGCAPSIAAVAPGALGTCATRDAMTVVTSRAPAA